LVVSQVLDPVLGSDSVCNEYLNSANNTGK